MGRTVHDRQGYLGNKVAAGLVADLSEWSQSISRVIIIYHFAFGDDDRSPYVCNYALDHVEIDGHARGKSRYLVFRYQLKSYQGNIFLASSLPLHAAQCKVRQ